MFEIFIYLIVNVLLIVFFFWTENKGLNLFQGDLKLSPGQVVALRSGPNSRGVGSERKWIKGFFPFTIDKSLSKSLTINQAF